MTPEEMLPDLTRRESVVPRRFDPRSAAPFVNKSVSEETRRAYKRAVADFFQFVAGLKLDDARRRTLHSGGDEAYLSQPLVNYRGLVFDKPLTPRMIQKIVARWGSSRGWGG